MKNSVGNLLVFSLLLPWCLAGQTANDLSFFGKNLHEIRQLALPAYPYLYFFKMNAAPFFSEQTGVGTVLPMARLSKLNDLPPVFCAADLAFFCRLELKMDKATRTPVRFRLGSQEYVDWLEGKSSARFMDFR